MPSIAQILKIGDNINNLYAIEVGGLYTLEFRGVKMNESEYDMLISKYNAFVQFKGINNYSFCNICIGSVQINILP